MSSHELKAKNIKNRVQPLRVMRYKDCPVYVRMIGTDLFMYDLIYNNEIYSANLVITPRKGQTKLSEVEIQRAGALIWAGAVTTIDTLLGVTPEQQKIEADKKLIEASGLKN